MNSKLKWTVLIVLLILAALLFRTCSKSNIASARPAGFSLDESFFHVPSDAAFIITANVKSLFEEVDFQTLSRTEVFREQLFHSYQDNPPFTYVFSDPSGTGIDISKTATFYITLGEEENHIYSNTILMLKSSASFQSAMDRVGLKDIVTKDDYHYGEINPMSAVAWSDEIACFFSTKDGVDKIALLDKIFNKGDSKYFDEHNKFQTYHEASSDDLNYWIDLDRYKQNPILHTKKLGFVDKKILSDNIIYGALNFEHGAVDLEVLFDFNDMVGGAIGDVLVGGYDKDVLKHLPSEQPSFISNISLDINGILKYLLNDSELKVKARNSLLEYGLTLSDFSKAFTGDLLFAAYPADVADKSSTIFSAKINNEIHFNSVMKVLLDLKKIELIKDGLYRSTIGVIPFFPLYATYNDKKQRILVKDGYMFVSLDKRLIDHVTSGKLTIDNFENHLQAFEPEENILSAFGTARYDKVAAASQKYSIKDFSIKYKKEHLSMHFNLRDDSRSALKQILNIQ